MNDNKKIPVMRLAKGVIKKNTNGGTPCKQIFELLKCKDNAIIHITKRVLIKDTDPIKDKYPDYTILKVYKNTILKELRIGFTLKTANNLAYFINRSIKANEKHLVDLLEF